MIFSLFGGKNKADDLPKERGPLGVAIGGAIEIDTLALQADAAGATPGMELPAGGSVYAATGSSHRGRWNST